MALNSIDEILDDFRQGKMVIVMDDEDRENEGDLLMAASLVRPEDINFMARYGRGLICLSLTRERCQQLRLPLMVQDNSSPSPPTSRSPSKRHKASPPAFPPTTAPTPSVPRSDPIPGLTIWSNLDTSFP